MELPAKPEKVRVQVVEGAEGVTVVVPRMAGQVGGMWLLLVIAVAGVAVSFTRWSPVPLVWGAGFEAVGMWVVFLGVEVFVAVMAFHQVFVRTVIVARAEALVVRSKSPLRTKEWVFKREELERIYYLHSPPEVRAFPVPPALAVAARGTLHRFLDNHEGEEIEFVAGVLRGVYGMGRR
jgi:hypothetical protein